MDLQTVIALVASVSSLLVAVAAFRQARATVAQVRVVEQAAKNRGSIQSISMSWDRTRGRRVAEIAAGDSVATLASLDVTIIFRRPVERVLMFIVINFRDLIFRIARDEVWLFFEFSETQTHRRLQPYELLCLDMTPDGTRYLGDELFAIEIVLHAQTSTGSSVSSSPSQLFVGSGFDRTPARFEGRGGQWHGVPLVYILEELATTSAEAVRALLCAVASNEGLILLAQALDLYVYQATRHLPRVGLAVLRPESFDPGGRASVLGQDDAREILIGEISQTVEDFAHRTDR